MCIIVTDRDGTPVLNVKADLAVEIGLATKPAFIATYTMATDQASKLGLGKNQSIVCMYSNYQVSLESFQTHRSTLMALQYKMRAVEFRIGLLLGVSIDHRTDETKFCIIFRTDH